MRTAPAEVSLDCKLGDAGWASLTMRVGDARLDIDSFSYTVDSFGDLLRAALTMATSGYVDRVSFEHEPGEHRLILMKFEQGRLAREGMRIEVRLFADYYAQQPDAAGDLVFSGYCAQDVFARAVARLGRALLQAPGAEGYRKSWDFAFPMRALVALEAALAMPRDG